MKRIVVWLLLVAALIVALLLLRDRTSSKLDVAPDALRQIERAKQR